MQRWMSAAVLAFLVAGPRFCQTEISDAEQQRILLARHSVWHARFAGDEATLRALVPPAVIVFSAGEKDRKTLRDIVDFQLTISAKRGLSAQIYKQLRAAILDGRLKPGQELPSSRDLASQLGIARKTVLRAYERLSGESLIAARSGSERETVQAMRALRNLSR